MYWRYLLFVLLASCWTKEKQELLIEKQLLKDWDRAENKLQLYEGVLWRLQELEDMENSRLTAKDSAWIHAATQNIKDPDQKERLLRALTRQYNRSAKDIEYEIADLLNSCDVETRTHIESLVIAQKLAQECEQLRKQIRPTLGVYHQQEKISVLPQCPDNLLVSIENPHFEIKNFRLHLERDKKIIRTQIFSGKNAILDSSWQQQVRPNDNLLISVEKINYRNAEGEVWEISFKEKYYINIAELYYEGL